MNINIEPRFYNAVIDRYLDGDFGIDFSKKRFFDLDSEELNLLGIFQNYATRWVTIMLKTISAFWCKFLKDIKLPRYMAIFTIKHQYMKWQNYLARKRIYISTKLMSKFHLIIIYRWFHHTRALVMLQIYFICLTVPSHTILKGILHIFGLFLKYYKNIIYKSEANKLFMSEYREL